MTYPNAPYGQGLPGQEQSYQPAAPPPQYPGYAQQPGALQQPGYPSPGGYPYPQPGYPGGQPPLGFPPGPAPTPSGVTGIIAGVLAALGGVANLLLGGFTAIGLAVLASDPHFTDAGFGSPVPFIAIGVLNVIVGGVLAAGAVTLFLRKSIGRWLVVAACAVYLVGGLISLALSLTRSGAANYALGGNAISAVSLVFPIATLVLALLPSTAAWIRAKGPRVPTPPPPHTGYPPNPGYPSHPGYPG